MAKSYNFFPLKHPFSILSVCTASLLFSMSQVGAQETLELDELVVSAGRFAIEAEKLGSATTIITQEQIENSGSIYTSDLLRSLPGVAVNRTGGSGGLTQVRLRGAEGNHVVVVIDGIEVNNSVQGEFDFSNLLAEDIERIEILRGPQSASWGSNALAGVINITTKKASKGFSASAKAQYGSFNSKLFSGRVAAGNDWARLAMTLTNQNTDGFNISDFGTEEDGDNNTTFAAKGDVDLAKNFNISGVLRYMRHHLDTDNQDFAFPATASQGLVIDTNNETRRKELYAKGEATLNLFDDRWIHKAFITGVDTKSRSYSDDVLSSGNNGERLNYGYSSQLTFETPNFANARHTIIGLVERETEKFRNTVPSTLAQDQEFKRTINGYVAEYRLDLFDSLFLTGAYRLDDNDKFDDAETYRLTAAYLIKDTGTRLHFSYGKGITNPTFFEQFGFSPDRFDGNPNLSPEESIGWDFGVEQSLFNKRLILDVTYFESNLENEIVSTFDNTTFRSSVDNLDEKSERKGVEVSFTAKPTDQFDITGAYTYTDSFEIRNGQKLEEVRRPEHTASLDVTYRFLQDRARLSAGVVYNGKSEDLEFISSTPETRVTLDDYTLLRLSGSYDVNDRVRWYGRLENLFDENYEEVFGFNTPGFAAYTGIKINLGE
jgi:vitamin B12 transporter